MESEHKLGGQRPPTVVSGPLAGYSAGFRQALIAQGYARRTIGDQMSMMAHLSRWLQAEGLDVKALQSAAEIDRFFAERRAGGCQTRVSSMALAGLLGFLREREIIGPAARAGGRAGRPAAGRVPGLPVRRARYRSGHDPRVHRMRRHVPRGRRSARETARRGAERPVGRRHHQVRGRLGEVPQPRLRQVDGVRAAEPAALPARGRVHRPAAGHRGPGGPRLAAGPPAAPGVRAGNRGRPGRLRPRKRTRAP